MGTFCFACFQAFPEPVFVLACVFGEHKAPVYDCRAPALQTRIHQLDLSTPAPWEGRMAAAAPVKPDAG